MLVLSVVSVLRLLSWLARLSVLGRVGDGSIFKVAFGVGVDEREDERRERREAESLRERERG